MVKEFIPICLIITLMAAHQSDTRKPKSLAMFNLQQAGFQGGDCVAASEIAAAAANARDDILPGYNLQFDYYSEGDGSIVPTTLFKYLFNFEANHDKGTMLAPIVLGSRFAPGCLPIAQLMHHVDMIAITNACGDPIFTGSNAIYPNFFRGTIGLEYFNFPQLLLMKYAKWNKIAIITFSGNRSNYKCAQLLYDKALQAGMEVVHFDSVTSTTHDVIQRLKDSDARIIAYEGQIPQQFSQLLCQAYKVGIRGPKYAFIIWSTSVDDLVANPNFVLPLPDPCTMDILKAQWGITFWAGQTYANIAGNNGVTELGYDLPAFNQLFNNFTNNTIFWDYPFTSFCQDTAQLGILALDHAERLLQSQNATLSDYTTQPGLVAEALRTVMKSMQFTNLQYGHVSYDSRGEFDNKPQYVMQTLDTGRINLAWKVTWDNVKYNWTAVVPEDFSYHEVSPIIWPTPNGQPPKDFPGNIILEESISTALFSVIVVIAAAGTVMHIVSVGATKSAMPQTNSTLRRRKPGIILVRILVTVACLFLNTAACLFAVNPEGFSNPEVVCYLQRVFLVVGQSMLSGCLAGCMSRLFQLEKKKKKRKSGPRIRYVIMPSPSLQTEQNLSVAASSSKRTSSSQHSGSSHSSVTVVRRRIHVFIGVFCFICVTINVAVLALWFGLAPMTVDNLPTNEIYFDEVLDAYVQVKVYQCISGKAEEFISILLCINFLINAMASCFAFGNRKKFDQRQVARSPMTPAEVRLIRFASWNGTMLFLLTIFIVTIMGFQVGPVEQNIALSFLILAISLSTSAIIAIPMAVISRTVVVV